MTQPESPGDGRRAPLPPELRTFRCESALPDPLEAQSSAKTLDGSLPGRRSAPVLNEKYGPPQCQKLVRWADLVCCPLTLPWSLQGRVSKNALRNSRFIIDDPTNTFALAARRARGFANRSAPGKFEGAGKTGCALHPRSRVQNCAKEAHTSIQVQRRHSGLPCAMALRLIRARPGDRACLTPSSSGYWHA